MTTSEQHEWAGQSQQRNASFNFSRKCKLKIVQQVFVEVKNAHQIIYMLNNIKHHLTIERTLYFADLKCPQQKLAEIFVGRIFWFCRYTVYMILKKILPVPSEHQSSSCFFLASNFWPPAGLQENVL